MFKVSSVVLVSLMLLSVGCAVPQQPVPPPSHEMIEVPAGSQLIDIQCASSCAIFADADGNYVTLMADGSTVTVTFAE
jgi:hypothetical protein